jgi:SagB-type dehydrogenase family enzyme
MESRGAEAILRYHESTKHSEWSVRTSRHFLDWANQPLPFKIYRDLEPIPLVRDFGEKPVPALEAVARDPAPRAAREGEEQVPDLAALSRVLQLSAGVTKVRRHAGGAIAFRAYPNTGALYHVDLYLVAAELPDLPAGVYHFGPHDAALRRLRPGDWRGVLVEASGGSPDLAAAPVVVASASTFWRNSWKYRARAWRHCFWDAGTLHANLLAAAATQELDARVMLGFADAPVERLLGLDPLREGALVLVPLGRTTRPPPPAREVPELRLATEPLSPREMDYPEIRAAHAASSLASDAEAAAWRERVRAREPAPQEPASAGPLRPLEPLPPAKLPRESLDRLVRRRGSTRAFDGRRSISFAELSTALDAATRGVPADFLEPPGATLLELHLIAHAVDGLDPGAYRYRREARSLELLREGAFRRAAGRLALGQDLAAEAAANVYSLVDLARVLERLGARGYRAAQLEGGIVGGRLYLAAYAQRFGATGLTFFDDEVTDFFSPSAAGRSVMFLTALGHPDREALGLDPR